MGNRHNWPREFAAVIGCERCSSATDRGLLRDHQENVPQPGFIGDNYWSRRVLLVGQNPGTPKSRLAADMPYTAALRSLREQPTEKNYEHLRKVLRDFIPKWPVHGNYFPLAEAGLALDDIAYCNVVRCRTSADGRPSDATAQTCAQNHLARWILLLSPHVVVFIGKWAFERGRSIVEKHGVPCDFMNRQRSLSSEVRSENRQRVASLVRQLSG
jgi:uracil-DNA glycosylase